MACAETPRQLTDHVVVGPAVGVRLEQLARDLDARVPGGLVDVVVLEELGGRRTMSAILAVSVMNCSCTHTNRSSRAKALVHLVELGRDAHRVGVLDQQRRDRRPGRRSLAVADQDRPDARLIEVADRRVEQIEPFDVGLVPVVQVALIVAPPPSCCQAPVTTGRQDAACMLAAPLRVRVKPKPRRRYERLVEP